MFAHSLKTRWIAPIVLAMAMQFAAAKPADGVLLKPTLDQAEAAQMATKILTRYHYKALPFDTAMSQKVFDRYLDSLDSDRLFFTQADIDRFLPARDKLDDAVEGRDLRVPFAIFNLYLQRVAERTAFARAQLKKGFDFNVDESYPYQREKAPWEPTDAAVNDLWRKRVKNDWLRLKLAGKDDAKIREMLDKRYANYLERIRQLGSEDVFAAFLNAYAMAIEPHTNYLGPRQAQNFDIAMRLSLEGIGAVLQREEDYTAIREIVPGGPAALSGKLKVGDRILGVGQGEHGPIVDVIGWRLDDVVEKIRGTKDTVVRLEVLPADEGPDGKHVMISLVRKKVMVEEQAAKSSIMQVKDGSGAEHKIGVITLPTFYQDFEARRRGDANYKSATRDVERLLGELKKGGVEGVLIDLRNNGGGSLNEATDLTGLFIDKGPVVQVRQATGHIDEEEDTHAGVAWSGPLAVLVNRNSASASEIFAAAIQDYGRGLIVGEPTYGKGTVQNLLDLDSMRGNEKPTLGELKMTIAQFFRVNGGSTQLRGVTPDIAFPITGDFDQNGEQAFDNALPWTSIAPANYAPAGDVKPLVPQLIARHDARVANDREWQALQADIADARKLRKETSISLNEATRRKERDDQEAKRRARHPEQFAEEKPADAKPADAPSGAPADAHAAPGAHAANVAKATPARSNADLNQDDGLQADERSLKADLDEEKRLKALKDVVLEEAARILADEVALLHADTKLAAHVLPQPGQTGKGGTN